jgi:diphthine-ammonia ligase
MTPAAVLWTGGKDSGLALQEACSSGYDVRCLITFTPPAPQFNAHPIGFMKAQAQAMNLPHHTVTVRRPYRESYVSALGKLVEDYGVGSVVTGDTGEVDGHPNWVGECGREAGVDVAAPLWGVDGVEVLDRLLDRDYRLVFSCVRRPWFTPDWVGRMLDRDAAEQLRQMSAASGVDVCGEQGEYHTLLLDGPQFRRSIRILSYTRRVRDELAYMDVGDTVLEAK